MPFQFQIQTLEESAHKRLKTQIKMSSTDEPIQFSSQRPKYLAKREQTSSCFVGADANVGHGTVTTGTLQRLTALVRRHSLINSTDYSFRSLDRHPLLHKTQRLKTDTDQELFINDNNAYKHDMLKGAGKDKLLYIHTYKVTLF